MEKFLLTIEFRYSDAPDSYGSTHKDKMVTIGVYDDFDEACVAGNGLMENLESKYPLYTFPDGSTAKKERFSKNGGCFGMKNDLISNLAYLKTPFSFFAKITTLHYDNVGEVIEDVTRSVKRYQDYKNSQND